MGWVAACVLVALMLPMLGMLYLDVLEAKHEAKAQLEKVEKLRRQMEKDRRDTPNDFKENPIFDRRKKDEHL